MYVGRILAVGRNNQREIVLMYRVSSRNFRNRNIVCITPGTYTVSSMVNNEIENPFISYNCMRCDESSIAVIGNGNHVDLIYNRIREGVPLRDSVAMILSSMDYEHDDFDTPRIAACYQLEQDMACMGVVSKTFLGVQILSLKTNEIQYITTYKYNYLSDKFKRDNFNICNVNDACKHIIYKEPFSSFDLPVSSLALVISRGGIHSAHWNASEGSGWN